MGTKGCRKDLGPAKRRRVPDLVRRHNPAVGTLATRAGGRHLPPLAHAGRRGAGRRRAPPRDAAATSSPALPASDTRRVGCGLVPRARTISRTSAGSQQDLSRDGQRGERRRMRFCDSGEAWRYPSARKHGVVDSDNLGDVQPGHGLTGRLLQDVVSELGTRRPSVSVLGHACSPLHEGTRRTCHACAWRENTISLPSSPATEETTVSVVVREALRHYLRAGWLWASGERSDREFDSHGMSFATRHFRTSQSCCYTGGLREDSPRQEGRPSPPS